jgi:hypothetical protein
VDNSSGAARGWIPTDIPSGHATVYGRAVAYFTPDWLLMAALVVLIGVNGSWTPARRRR